MATGDMIQYNGTSWVKVTPTQITAVTQAQIDTSGHNIQVKTRTVYGIAPGTESGWTTIPGGAMVQGVTA